MSSTARIADRCPITVGQKAGDGELRFRAVFDGAAIGIAICTLDGYIVESNSELSKVFGYTREEFVGMHDNDFHPGDFEQDQVLLGELMPGERESFQLEKRYRRKGGVQVGGKLTAASRNQSLGS